MTIGALPRHPGFDPRSVGGPLIVPIASRDGTGNDAEGFAQVLQQVGAERLNEGGFFAHAGALAAPSTGAGDADVEERSAEQALPVAIPPVLDPADRFEPLAVLTEAPVASTIDTMAKPAVSSTVTTPATGRRAAATIEYDPIGAMISIARSTAGTDIETPPIASRPVVARQRSTAAAKTAVGVTVDTADGAAAIAISARGLTDRQIDALRIDIVALLRRHGLAIDDLKLNGRPMGQGKHDRSGG